MANPTHPLMKHVSTLSTAFAEARSSSSGGWLFQCNAVLFLAW
jgi:hypothetical protein